jgi:opacity protein-like surface antigen
MRRNPILSACLGLALGLTLITAVAVGASPGRAARFGASVAVGWSEPDPSSWSFPGVSDVDVGSGLGYSFAISYGPVPFFSGALLSASAEVSHTHAQTDDEALKSPCCGYALEGTARMDLSVTGLLICARLAGPSRLSPFVQFGVGSARVAFSEQYSWDALRDVEFDYWRFAYGAAAGLQFEISPRWRLMGSLRSIIVPGDKIEARTHWAGGDTGVYDRAASFMGGIHLEVRI